MGNVIGIAQKSFNTCIQGLKTYCAHKDAKARDLTKNLKSLQERMEQQAQIFKSTEDALIFENTELVKKLKEVLKEHEKQTQQNQELKDKHKLFMGRFDENKILKEIKEMISENDNIRDFAREIKSELEYGKQRENKLMYFLFVLQQRGYPIFEVFEKDIKRVSTARFSINLDEEYKNIFFEEQKKIFVKSKWTRGILKSYQDQKWEKLSERIHDSFTSNGTSMPIEFGKPPEIKKPNHVPGLDFNKMFKKQEEEFNSDISQFENQIFKKSIIVKPQSAKLRYEKSEEDEGESDWSCSYCLGMHKSEDEGMTSICSRELSVTEFKHHVSPEQIEDRNRRVENLLKSSNTDNYKMIKNLNKMQELEDSFEKGKK